MFKNNRLENWGNRKRRKGSILFRFFITILIIGIIYLLFIVIGYNNFKNGPLVTEEKIVTIKEGETANNLAEIFGLNKNYLKYYIKNNNPDYKLIAGKFKIEAGSNIEEILESLQKPMYEGEIGVTILEGRNIYDIDEYLSYKWLINKGDFINYVSSSEKIEKLTDFFPFIEGLGTLEGFLYPDTYTVDADNFKINEFVIKQLETFESKVYNTILSELSNKEIIDLVNLASIVEKEEKNSDEKPTVAGILKKRLENGWMLGADITVCYPHKLTSQECKLVVSKYIKEESEYNTRTMTGLPKTPIGSPSYDTIYATLNSKETEYWYYLHNSSTGQIYYGKTNAEHEQNKSLYMK